MRHIISSFYDNLKEYTILLLLHTTLLPLVSQQYDPTDSLALLTIDAACDASNTLNWNTEPDPGLWIGIIWNSDNPKRVTEINVFYTGIVGTLDVSSLTELKTLIGVYNNLVGINISGLTKLEKIYCWGNAITTLDASGLTNLKLINCAFNAITNLNIEGANNLDTLICYANSIDSLDVSNRPYLKCLECNHAFMKSLNVTGDTSLVKIHCYRNDLTELDVSTCKNLDTLVCVYNNLPLSSLSSGLFIGGGFSYSPQNILFQEQNVHENIVIDYSPEALINGVRTEFSWYKYDNLVGTDTLGQLLTTGNGKYKCTMTNSLFPDLILETAWITVSGIVGLEDTESRQFNIFPNPAKDRIYITQPDGIVQIIIYSITGAELINTTDISAGIDISGLNPGIYVIKLVGYGEQVIGKITVE